MASIYDKALKRKDFSGIVDPDALASKALAADDARVLRSTTTSPTTTSTGATGTQRGSEETDATLTLPISTADTNAGMNEEEAADRESITGRGNEHRFELRDLNVVSSEEELTAVTGPRASGKTALLVRNSSSLVFHRGRVNVRRC